MTDSPSSDPDPFSALLHQVNNLLGVIKTQSEVAALVPGEQSARDALRHIQGAADRTEELARRLRQQRRADG